MHSMHHDVRAQRLLDSHRALGAQVVPAAIEMALEGHAPVVDVPALGQAEDLVATAVGEDGAVPG